MRTTEVSNAVNSGVAVGNVPADAGTAFLRPSEPAIASAGIIRKKRPTSIATAPVVLYQRVLPVRPPNAEPLLLACELNAYVTSVRPWGPWLPRELSAWWSSIDAPAKPRITTG